MKVIAIEKGYYYGRRRKGDVFDVHFSEEVIARSSWLRPVGQAPAERTIPDFRDSRMAEVLKGVPPGETPRSMSEATAALLAQEDENPRAYGREPTEPAKRKPGRPKGSKNKASKQEVSP